MADDLVKVEGEAFDEAIPDEETVDEDAFAALQAAWLEGEHEDG